MRKRVAGGSFPTSEKGTGAIIFVHPKKAVNVRKPEFSLSVKRRG
jgi:hypothetical protein